MPCDVHSWWFDTVCPECAKLIVPVTLAQRGWLEIPEFLQRNPDNTMGYPDVQMAEVVVPRGCAEPVREAPSTLADRQEHYRAAYEADKRKRAQERNAKLKNQRTEKQTWELTRRKRPRT